MDFKTKAEEWPRVSTAAELASLLQNVRRYHWRDYQYSADPPCPNAETPGSLIFGDAPGGGLVVTCWGCGSGFIDELEESLKYALQVRYQDGRLRFRANSGGEWTAPVQRSHPYQQSELTLLNASLPQAGFTVRDFAELQCWFVGQGKKGHSKIWRGRRFGWRQSKPAEEGGIALARFGGDCREKWGGKYVPVEIRPWASYSAVCESIKVLERLGSKGIAPVFGMGGDANTPAPHALIIVDVDYKPSKDADGKGKEYRDSLLSRFTDAGWAIYSSTSGNGYHAIAQLSVESFSEVSYEGRAVTKIGVWEPFGKGSQSETGVALDLFFPGAPFLVAVKLDKPLANASADHILPIVTATEINALVAIGE